jgi:copper chaperone CopZ
LGEIDGTTDVKVDLDKGEATFDEATPVDMNTVQAAVKKAGFEVV